MQFESKDKMFGLRISKDLLQTLEPELQRAGENETGGILIGHYDEELHNAHLHTFSPPPADSEAGPTWFRRGNKGLYRLLMKSWREGRYYLGEWHFHPKAAPTPSAQDLRQMEKIAKDASYRCPEPVMVIVGGTATSFHLRAFVFAGEPVACIELH